VGEKLQLIRVNLPNTDWPWVLDSENRTLLSRDSEVAIASAELELMTVALRLTLPTIPLEIQTHLSLQSG
jgi:hypothetical protein